jgi:hypothetical protein
VSLLDDIAAGPKAPNPLAQIAGMQQLQGQQQIQQQRAVQIQGDQTDNNLKSLALAKGQQSQQDTADTRAAYAAATDPQTGQVDHSILLSTLAKLNPIVAAQTASGLAIQDTAAKEAAAKLQETQVAAATAHLDLKDKLLQGTNQATWPNTRAIALQSGMSPQEIPEQYPGDAWVAQMHAQTMNQKETLQAHLDQQKADEETRHSQAVEANTAAEQAATAAYRKAELANQATRQLGENAGTVSIAQVPDGKGGMKSVLLNNKSGAISETDPGLRKPSATQPPMGEPTTADRNRASLASVALANIDKIDEIVKRRGDMLGPGAGRISNIDQLIGSNDPDLVALVNEAHNFSMANAGVHGSRSVMNVRDAVKDLLGDLHNGPQGIQGGLDANRANLQAIIAKGTASPADQGNAPKPGATYQQTATGPNNHKIGSNDGGKTWVDVQTGKPVQ